MACTTEEALEQWSELVQETAEKFGELIDTSWKDLPPDVADALADAINSFAEARERIDAHLPDGDELDESEREEYA